MNTLKDRPKASKFIMWWMDDRFGDVKKVVKYDIISGVTRILFVDTNQTILCELSIKTKKLYVMPSMIERIETLFSIDESEARNTIQKYFEDKYNVNIFQTLSSWGLSVRGVGGNINNIQYFLR
jgi:hypothetical protein